MNKNRAKVYLFATERASDSVTLQNRQFENSKKNHHRARQWWRDAYAHDVDIFIRRAFEAPRSARSRRWWHRHDIAVDGVGDFGIVSIAT